MSWIKYSDLMLQILANQELIGWKILNGQSKHSKRAWHNFNWEFYIEMGPVVCSTNSLLRNLSKQTFCGCCTQLKTQIDLKRLAMTDWTKSLDFGTYIDLLASRCLCSSQSRLLGKSLNWSLIWPDLMIGNCWLFLIVHLK